MIMKYNHIVYQKLMKYYNSGYGMMLNIYEKFTEACAKISGGERNPSGIGTLGEKALHSILKYTYEPDVSRHEIKVGGFYADIVNEQGIIEIHTRNFNTLRKKLEAFLEVSRVTIVYPVAYHKWLVWIDTETGEITEKRLSPRRGRADDVFAELYKIKPMLIHPNLRIDIVMLDMTEYRWLNGWSHDGKKGSSRYERIPEKLAEIISLEDPDDYTGIIPEKLTGGFTVKDYSKASGATIRNSGITMNIMNFVGAVEKRGKKGNAFIYSIRK